jgi:hypothetical protein
MTKENKAGSACTPGGGPGFQRQGRTILKGSELPENPSKTRVERRYGEN